MDDVIVIESSKEEGELSDDEDETNSVPRNSPKSHSRPSYRPPQNNRPNQSSHYRDRDHGNQSSHTYKYDKQSASKTQSHAPSNSRYDSHTERNRNRTRDRRKTPPKNLQSHHDTQNAIPEPKIADSRSNAITTAQKGGVQSLLDMDIPIPAAYLPGIMKRPPPPPPPPPPLPDEPPPDKPEPPPLNLPQPPRQRPRKGNTIKNLQEPGTLMSPPAGDVEDSDYIDLLLEYQEIKKELDIITKVEKSSSPAGKTKEVVSNDENKEGIQELEEEEENDILELRLNALKTVASDSPVKQSSQGKTAKANKRALPFAPRNFDPPSSRPSKLARREGTSTILRERTGQYYWDVPRPSGRTRDRAVPERRRQDRRREEREQRRRDEDKRRAEKRKLDEEYEANRRRLEVQKIVTLDDPKEQYKRFMELVAGVEKSTRSEVTEKAVPPAQGDNYEEVAMDLDSDGEKSAADGRAGVIPDVFNLPKLDPDTIPGLEPAYSDQVPEQHEPAFTSDLMSFGPASTGFHETFDSPAFANLYVSPPSKECQTALLPPVGPSIESPEPPESSEEIPGLGWSNEPSKPEAPIDDMAPEPNDKSQGDTEEDEEAILRAKLLKSLFMRKKMQEEQETSSHDPSPHDQPSPTIHPPIADTSPTKASPPPQSVAYSSTANLKQSPPDTPEIAPAGDLEPKKELQLDDVDELPEAPLPVDDKSSRNDSAVDCNSDYNRFRKVPRHDPVVIRIGDSSDEELDTDGQKDGTSTPEPQKSSERRMTALPGNLDSFIKEARMSVEAKSQASDSDKPIDVEPENTSVMITPEVMKALPRTKVEEYKKLKEILRKKTGSSAKLSAPASPVDVTADEQIDDTRMKTENQQKELRQKLVLLQLELVQQKHSLRINKDTLTGIKHEITKKRAVLRMGEEHVQKLREQLAAAEKIVQSNRIQLNVFNEQAQDAQSHVDERMARVQALEAQLLSVGRQAYGEHFTPKMAAGALQNDPLAKGSKSLSVTIGKNQQGARQVIVPVATESEESNTASPVRKVVVIKKKPAPATAIRKVKMGAAKSSKPTASGPNPEQSVKSLKTPEDIATEKARLMLLEKKYAAMIEKHKARQRGEQVINKKTAVDAKKPSMPAPEVPSPSGTMWKSLRRRSSGHVRRDSEPEHVHTEEMMSVDNQDPSKLTRQSSLLDNNQSTKPSLGRTHKNRQAMGGGDAQPNDQKLPPEVKRNACFKITNKANFNKALKSYRTTLQQRFKESIAFSVQSSKSSGLPKLKPFAATSYEESTTILTPNLMYATAPDITDDTDIAADDASSSLKEYVSPLLHLRSYRLSPYYRTKEKLSLVSHSYSHKINPHKPLCPFDVTGKCNDEKCARQHSVHYKLSPAELLKDFSSYHPPMITDDKSKLNDELDAFVDNFSKTHNKKFTLDQQCLLLVSKVNKAANQDTPHTTVTEPRPWRPRQKQEKSDVVDDSETSKSKSGSIENFVLLENDVRYWSSAATCWEDMEAAVLNNPTDVDMWLKLAYHKLYSGQNRDENLDQALNVLSRGVESNTGSSRLWLHYLGLYARRADTADLAALYQQALNYAPSYQLYWKYLETCSTTRDRSEVCHQMMKFLLSDLCTEPPGEKSHHLLEIIIHQVSLYVNIRLEQQGLELIQCAVEIPPSNMAPDPWHILSQSDRLLLMLTHVHLQQFHSLPRNLFNPSGKHPGWIVNKAVWSLPWGTLFHGLSPSDPDTAAQVERICSGAQAALQKWIHQIHTATQLELTPAQADHRDLDVLHGNVVDMYLAAGRHRLAQDYCVELLSDDHVQKAMYIKLEECAAANKDETPSGVKCWYRQAILHLPTCARAYQLAADYEMQQGDEDAALELMEQCALAMFDTDSAMSTSCDPNLLFCKLLKQSVPLDFESPPLKPVVTSGEIAAQQADLWNCYCLLLDLQGCTDQASEAFESAVLALRGTDQAATLWIRYLRHEHKVLSERRGTDAGDVFSQFTSLVLRCLRTLPCRTPLPHSTCLTWLDYSPHSAVLDIYLPTVPEGRHVAVYQRLLAEHPGNVPLLLRAVNHLQKTGHVALARGYCVTSLMDHPHCLALWNIYISLLQKENNILEMRTAYRQATRELPLVANLWKDFAQFELLQGSEDLVRDVTDRSPDPEVNLADWIQTWAGGKVKVTASKDNDSLQETLTNTIQKNLASIRKDTESGKAKKSAVSCSIDVLESNRDLRKMEKERKENLKRQGKYKVGNMK